MKPLIPQVPNINGTSRTTLIEDYHRIDRAFRALDEALGLAMPHGRDYQGHHDPLADVLARGAWQQRRNKLEAMRVEFLTVAEKISK